MTVALIAGEKPLLAPHTLLEAMELNGGDLDAALEEFGGDLEEKQEYIEFYRGKLSWFREEFDLKTTLGRRNTGLIRLEVLYDFLAHFQETGERVASAQKAGTSWPTIKRRITKGDKLYLADFAYAYRAVCDEKSTGLKDKIYRQAVDGKEKSPVNLASARLAIEILDKEDSTVAQAAPEIRPVNVLIQNVTEKAGLTGPVVQVT